MGELLQVDQKSRTRGQITVGSHCQTHRNESFFDRIVETCNSLLDLEVTSSSANEFKSKLIDHWRNHLKKFGV